MIFKTVYESDLNKCFFVPELVGSELKASIGNFKLYFSFVTTSLHFVKENRIGYICIKSA